MSDSKYNHSNLSGEQASAPQSWATSFGDLLTLLLAFFLMIIVTSPRVQPEGSEKAELITRTYDGIQIEPEFFEKASLKTTNGISFAIPKSEPAVYELLLTDRSFSEPVSLFDKVADFRQILKRETEDRQLYRVVIEACESSSEASEEAAWKSAMQKVLELRRQLIDRGFVDTGRLRIRALGGHCKLIEASSAEVKDTSKVFIARLAIEEEF